MVRGKRQGSCHARRGGPAAFTRRGGRAGGRAAGSEAAEEVGELLPVDHPVAVAVGLLDQLAHAGAGAEHGAQLRAVM